MKIKFKLGDRVNYVCFGNGTIIDTYTCNLTTQYLVEFDEENETYLHSEFICNNIVYEMPEE